MKNGGSISIQVTRSRTLKLPCPRIPALPLLIACLYFLAPNVDAASIKIDLGGAPNITSQVDSPFAALDGIALQGQTLSLDFFFSSGEFVRLFSITSDSFHAQITLQTSGMGQVGFLSGTGFLFDQHGNPLDAAQDLGSASGDDGSMAAGLFPLFGPGLPRPSDFFGVHLDLTLPNSPFVAITGSGFTLSSDSGFPFGVGPGVPPDITTPDLGSSFLMMCLGSIGLILVRMRIARASWKSILGAGAKRIAAELS